MKEVSGAFLWENASIQFNTWRRVGIEKDIKVIWVEYESHLLSSESVTFKIRNNGSMTGFEQLKLGKIHPTAMHNSD